MTNFGINRRDAVRSITTGLAATWLGSAQTDVTRIRVGESELEVTCSGGMPDLTQAQLLEWVNQCAIAVARYFGRFPAPKARLAIFVREEIGRAHV